MVAQTAARAAADMTIHTQLAAVALEDIEAELADKVGPAPLARILQPGQLVVEPAGKVSMRTADGWAITVVEFQYMERVITELLLGSLVHQTLIHQECILKTLGEVAAEAI
jgi:hypothetical protein